MRYLIVLASMVTVRGASQPPLLDRVSRAPDGVVRMSYAARAGVCGNGTWIVTRPRADEWENDCDAGPVRLSLTVRGGRVQSLRTYVGGRWRDGASPDGGAVTDLGTVGAPAAAEMLVALAQRDDTPVADRALGAAALADSATIWPALLRIAKDANSPTRLRRIAVHQLGQAAGESISGELGALADRADEDLRVREAALYALSQRPRGEGIPALIRIARQSPEPQLRKRAVYALAQSEDPRAVALFEELLVKKD
ncbi:MAG: HEAT repeat domain-containing protein [Gemmatimonadaceae bacterium]